MHRISFRRIKHYGLGFTNKISLILKIIKITQKDIFTVQFSSINSVGRGGIFRSPPPFQLKLFINPPPAPYDTCMVTYCELWSGIECYFRRIGYFGDQNSLILTPTSFFLRLLTSKYFLPSYQTIYEHSLKFVWKLSLWTKILLKIKKF